MGLKRVFIWLALSSSIVVQAQTAATTTQASIASASFAYVSDDGCVQNEVVVFANKSTVGSGKAPVTSAEVTYSRYRYDFCEDSDLGTDMGTSVRPAFSADLNRASLNATISGHTPSGSVVTVSLVLEWDGKGSVTRQVRRPQNARASGSEHLSRNASVSGTMDGEDISDEMVGASLHTTRKTASR